MSNWKTILNGLLAAFCLALSSTYIVSENQNRLLKKTLEDQQAEINRGAQSQQAYVNIVRDLAQASVEDSNIKALLAKRGINVTVNPPNSANP